MAAIAGKSAAVYSTLGASGVTFTNEATTANGARTVYQITSTTKRLWDSSAAFTVQHDIGGGYVTVTNYRLDYAGGYINFDAAEPVGAAVRVSGKYLTATEVATANAWKLDIASDVVDSTVFADDGWRAFTPVIKGASGSFSGFYLANTYALQAGTKVIAVLYADEAGVDRYEAEVTLSGDAINTTVEGLIEEEVPFTVNGALYYQAT